MRRFWKDFVLWVAREAEFNDATDGIVYGFAAGENLFYITDRLEGDLIAAAIRIFDCVRSRHIHRNEWPLDRKDEGASEIFPS